MFIMWYALMSTIEAKYMRWRRVGYPALFLLFLICAASAVVPDHIQIQSDHAGEWYVANGTDSGIITISISNLSTPINGYQITFSVNNSLASVNPVSRITDINGVSTTNFLVQKTSGDVLLNASIQYRINDTNTSEPFKYKYVNLTEHIDHDTPYRISVYNYSNEMTVGSTNQIQFSFVDRWGNPIDNRHIAEQVQLTVSAPPPQNGGFLVNSSLTSQTVFSVDQYGNITANLKINSAQGWNVVMIHPFGMTTLDGQQAIPDKLLMIDGIPGIPWSIVSTVDPPNSATYADGLSQFHISYYLWDQYGNPVQNRSIQITTSIPGEDKIIGTNQDGLAMMMYGPKTSIGVIWINASALDNSSVTLNQQVRFISQEPVDMLLTASPQTMPSIDAEPGFSADVLAKVTDILGNPVENQTVTFAINNVRYDSPNYSAAATSAPYLSSTSAVTDQDGYATVAFTPGGFLLANSGNSSYNATATGRCNVTATWTNQSHSIQLVWKNYPYLSVAVSTNTSTVTVNDTVLVDIQLKGDGWALQPNPIDAVLVIDRSGSMADDSPSKISSARNAAKLFVSNMNNVSDRVAIVSFAGYTAGTQTRTDISLTHNFANVNSSIDSLSANGATETRTALKQAIDLIRSNPNSNPRAVKAIVLLTDGNWNLNGTPLGHGTGWPANETWPSGSSYSYSTSNLEPSNYMWYPGLGGTLTKSNGIYKCTNGESTDQNMTNYAIDSGIRLYMISLGSSLDTTTAIPAMKTMANASGGFYQNAPTGADLAAIYTKIAGDLQTTAGVNTGMNLKYDQIQVNYVMEPNTGNNQTLQYVPAPGISTFEDSYWVTNGTHLPTYPTTIDQTGNWSGNPRQLVFNAGTIYLNQVWEAKYLLKVMQTGNINIFGPNSTISFNAGSQTISLPDTYVSSVPNMTNTNVTTYILKYTNVTQSGDSSSGSQNPFITFNINSTYTGTMSVTEDYYIITSDLQKHQVGSRVLTPAEANQPRTFTILAAALPLGPIQFSAVMNVPDAPGPIKSPPVPINIPSSNKVYINLT